MVRVQEGSSFRSPPLARIFHSFPHLNVSLHLVNSTFDPESELYRESIGILGSIPAAWLIVSMFLLLIYLLTRCCDRKPRPKHSIVVLKWTLAIFAILCCMSIGVSLYGNDDLHNGMVQFIVSAKNINQRIEKVQNQTYMIENSLEYGIPKIMVHLVDVFDKSVHNQTGRSILFKEMTLFNQSINASLNTCKRITNSLKFMDIQGTISMLYLAETIRWPVTMGILSVLLIFCIVLLFGIARHSRCALVMFSVVGLFAIIISFLLSSIYLATSVGTGDFCMAPNAYVEHAASSTIQAEIVEYYISCEYSRSNPFTDLVRRGRTAAEEMSTHLHVISRIAISLCDPSDIHQQLDMLASEVKKVLDNMTALPTLLDCRPIHLEYIHMLFAVCDLGLFGVALMLVGSIVSGLFFYYLSLAGLAYMDLHPEEARLFSRR